MIRKHDIYIRSYLGEGDDEDGNPIKLYGDIIKFVASINSVSGSYDNIVYGERAKRMVQSFVDYDDYIDVFKEGDLVYLYGSSYENEKFVGANANYKVESVLPQNLKIKLIMERLP